MTTPLPRAALGRRALIALPMLLVPLLMTACSSPGGSSSPGTAADSTTTASAASASTAAAGGGTDLYARFTTGAQLCAVLPLSDVSTAMRVEPGYATSKPTTSPLECTYDAGSASSIVSVAWSPKGDGLLDNYLKASGGTKPVAIDVGGQAGRSLNGDVQVVVGDAAIDVFGVGSRNLAERAALAAAFAKKVG